ncbi:hypothetical protein DSM101010T_34770 [Desulfovibrio subterraneus]|uniref:Knr4/Smi1-like domain-containing protein n=1 Tax=Desulfovibrio subterraneus TaxID=2718620 RepID=A0A7J0BPH4_9BACT|nr:hypothetical protein DSM101010T_34770 [Desulfovibrio subterraneus]
MNMYCIGSAIDCVVMLAKENALRPPCPSDFIIDKFQAKYGVNIHKDHRALLSRVSNIFFRHYELLTITEREDSASELSEALLFLRENGVPKDWVPVCESNGDYFCVDSDGVVHFWSHNGPTDEKWESLAHWVKQVWIDGE